MTAQYDNIAREYQATKTSPLRRYVEAYTLRQLLGDVSGLRVLDLACGDGFYTRMLAELGAVDVCGVDVSPEMIALAQQAEDQQRLGIRYECADVAAMPDLGACDVVCAAYLLHYAPDTDALRAMCRKVAHHLQPGGRFVAINENPAQRFAQHGGYTQYGFNKQGREPQQDGSPIRYSMISGRSMIHFDVFHYEPATYAAALQDAGFTRIDWRPLQLDPLGRAEMGKEYFAEYLENPPVTGLVCER